MNINVLLTCASHIILDSKGVFMLSNSDTVIVRDMYSHYKIKQVFASKQSNAKASGRGKIAEILILHY